MEEIRAFIDTHCGIEKTELLWRTINCIEDLGRATPSVAIGYLINDGANMESAMIQDQIHHIVEDSMDNIFKEMEFVIEGSLIDKVLILESIAMLENSSSSEAICSVIDNNDDPKEVWMALLTIVSLESEDRFFENLISVPERSLERLYKVHEGIVAKKELLSSPMVKVLSDAKRERLERYLTARPMSLLRTAINESYRVGVDKEVLLNRFSQELLALHPGAPKDAAYELIGLGLLMDLPEKGFITALRDIIREHYEDARFNATAIFELDRITMELKLYG